MELGSYFLFLQEQIKDIINGFSTSGEFRPLIISAAFLRRLVLSWFGGVSTSLGENLATPSEQPPSGTVTQGGCKLASGTVIQ
jgi:hypothetical protein